MSRLDEFHRRKTAHLWPVTLLRVYTGVYFLYFGFGKVRRGGFADGMERFLNAQLDNTFGFFRPFIESVVLPNKALFGFLVSWGEIAVGLALVLGLATRWAAVAGAIMVLSFWFAKGTSLLNAQNHDAVWFVIFIVLAFVHAGRMHSLDQRLGERFRFLA